MFTIVVFWQDKKWNDEINWFVNNGNTDIGMIALEYSKSVSEIKKDIVFKVGAAEQWRLIFVDNYQYRCAFNPYSDDMAKSSNYCKDNCPQSDYECGRNPFIKSCRISNIVDSEHRRRLIELLKEMKETRDQFLPPKEMFVIAVRDDDYSCKKEAFLSELDYGYWQISDEFPSFCRYFVYDMQYIKHELHKRELYWMYCLILILAQSELYMDRFQPRYMYRIKVKYSLDEYHKYLKLYKEEIRVQIVNIEMEEQQYRKRIKEKGLFPYPLTVRSDVVNLRYDLERKLDTTDWEIVKKEIKNDVWNVYHKSAKEYEDQWNELRRQVSCDNEEYFEIFENKKLEYENQLFNFGFSKRLETIPFFDRNMDEDAVDENINILLDEYEDYKRNQMKVRGYIITFLSLTILLCSYYLYIININKRVFEWESVGTAMIISFFSVLIYYLKRSVMKKRIISNLKVVLAFLDDYQKDLVDVGNKFLLATRDTMLYWKRIQNLEDFQKRIEYEKKALIEKKHKLELLLKQLSTLWNLEKNNVKIDHISKDIVRKSKDILVHDKMVKTEYIFIKEVTFKNREGRRGRDT